MNAIELRLPRCAICGKRMFPCFEVQANCKLKLVLFVCQTCDRSGHYNPFGQIREKGETK